MVYPKSKNKGLKSQSLQNTWSLGENTGKKY